MAASSRSASEPPMPHCFRPENASGTPHARILAYGDCLTAGYHRRDSYGGKEFAPYGQYLVEALAPEVIVELWVCGLSFATAARLAKDSESTSIKDFAGRQGVGINVALAMHGPFDLVLIMLGTNDLETIEQADCPARSIAQRIFDNIKRIHAACHEINTPTVVLSVPESRRYCLSVENGRDPDYVDCWKHLNALLLEWSAENREKTALFIDTGTAMPWSRASDYWESDGLHFSAAGSSYFGDRIAETLLPAIRTDEKDGYHRVSTDAPPKAPRPAQVLSSGAALCASEIKLDKSEDLVIDSTKEQDQVSFSVVCKATKPGEAVFIIGSSPSLGAWQPVKAMRLETDEKNFPKWSSEALCLGEGRIEFKVIVGPEKNTGVGVRWEAGENRSVVLKPTHPGAVICLTWRA